MNSFQLKMIALLTMIVDHAGLIYSGVYDTNFMRIIGRIAFPIFVFFIAEGCRHTRNLEKYMLRLATFAIVSEIPYDLMVKGKPFDLSDQNVFFTLFFGVLAVWVYEMMKERLGEPVAVVAALVAVVLPALAAYALKTDYGAAGTIMVFMIYLCKKKPYQLLALTGSLFYLYVFEFSRVTVYFFASMIAVFLLALYTGERGKKIKWAFYAAYPAHILMLVAVFHFTAFH